MNLLSYDRPTDRIRLLKAMDEEYSIQYLSPYSEFYKEFYNQQVYIIHCPEMDAWMPVRIFHSKIFRLGQILFAPVSDQQELAPKDQLIFFNKMLRFLRTNKICDRLIQPHPYAVLAALPPKVQFCEFGTYIIDLQNQTSEKILNKFHPKYQKAIAHSVKHRAKVIVHWDVFEDFYKIYEHTMHRVNQHKDPRSYFRIQGECLGADHAVPAVVYDEDKPVGAAFFIYSKYASYCTHAGSMGETKLYGAMKLLHLEVIRFMKEKSVKRYDLVGVRIQNTDSSLEGIFRFKKGFGGNLKAGYLWKTNIHSFRGRLYSALIKIRNRGRNPFPDIIDQSYLIK